MPPDAKGVSRPAHARVTVVAGRASTGKTARLLDQYRGGLRGGPPGVGLWLAPHQRVVEEIRGRLLDASLPSCLAPNVMTFDHFAERVLAADARPVQKIDPLVQRGLVAQLVAEAVKEGRIRHFAPIADRPGFVDLCLGFIAELKRLEIWPEAFAKACKRRGLTDKDREWIELYDRYQRTLVEHGLYDLEGRHGAARQRLERGETRPFEDVRLVVVDGFTNFTKTQQGVLRALAAQADEMLISLPLESSDERADLFAKTRETLAQLQTWRADANVIRLEPASASDWPALRHVESELFSNPRRSRPAPSTDNIEIIAAARPLDELETIGRQIKRLLLDGDPRDGRRVSPSEVAVVFRRVEDSAPLVREVFAELGLPVMIESGESLRQSPALVALIAAVELARDDWPFRKLLGLLSNTFIRPGWKDWNTGSVAAAERMIRELQIPSGRTRLREQVDRWAAQSPDPTTAVDEEDESFDRRRHRHERARRAAPLLARLAEALDMLPSQATPSEWSAALRTLAETLGIDRAIEAGMKDRPERARNDRSACEAFHQTLAAQERAWQTLGRELLRLSRDELLELAGDILAHGRIPRSHDEAGHVRVLSADRVRSLHVPYLFVANLAEKAFPPPEREERLYDESELESLSHVADLPFVFHTERSQEEMLLFYEVITRATRRLVLSYPGLDEKAQPLLPSPYLAEVIRVCGEKQLARHDVTDLSPLPQVDEPLSPAEARVLAVHRALSGDANLAASLLARDDTQPTARNIAAGLQTIDLRAERKTFGPFEGLLAGDEVRAKLRERFSPDRRWSASQLESYFYCPYRFLLEHVLGLEPLAELTLDVDYLARGRLVHAVLAELHRRLKDLPGQASDTDMLARHFDEVMQSTQLRRFGDRSLAEAFELIDRRLLTHWKQTYLEHHERYHAANHEAGAPLTAAHFEVSFGLEPVSEDPLSRAEPFTIRHRDQHILLAGRIDRIDVGQVGEQKIFNIIDYKTGRARFKPADVERGRSLQLTLYAMAVEELLMAEHGAVANGIGYWYLKEGGFRDMCQMLEQVEGTARRSDEWQAIRQTVLDTVWSLVEGIRGGEFPVYCEDDKCSGGCDFKTVCRVNHVRSLEKTWQPPQPSA